MILPLFLIPVVVGLLTQAIKPLINKQWYAELDAAGKKIPRYGGMPSAHTSFAFSLATVVGFTDGITSTTFAITASMVIFVLDDALRMRLFLSRHGLALRQLITKLPLSEQEQYPYLESRLGHRLSEVIVGALIGIGLSLVLLRFLA
jgi:acid phosphatase family membrane protein YuiD